MTGDPPPYTGPRIGDTVRVEVPVTGVVIAAQGYNGVPGVEIDTGHGTAWFPLDVVTLVRRRGEDS